MGRRRRRQGRRDQLLQGVLLVDKPEGLTSHDVCQSVKTRLRLEKVGHGGTLDPFATGLLPLLLNGATRLMPQLQGVDKTYEAVVRLGSRTDTMDPTGDVIAEGPHLHIHKEKVEAALAQFVGKIEQTIPVFSAARVDGKRLYEYARAGEDVDLPTKEVTIASIELLSFEQSEAHTDIQVRVDCSAGTYIRVLADDLGQALGVPAHLFSLRRTRTGDLDVAAGLGLATIEDQAETWKVERLARQESEDVILRFEPEANTRRWREFLGEALLPVSELLGGVQTLRVPAGLAERVQGGSPIRKQELAKIDPGGRVAFRPGDRLVLEDDEGIRAFAVMKAACSSESLSRRDGGDIVLDVERVLR